MSKLVTPDQAVARIADGAVVTVSSSSALGCPDKVLEALGDRFRATGAPRGLTTIHPIAAGDMYGVKGIDHIAQDGLLARVIAGSYPSGGSNLPMPEIWKMVTEGRIPAYNVPSGILFDMHCDVAARKPGVLTQVGLETFVDPVGEGCAMNAKGAAQPIVFRVEFGGPTWLHFPNIAPDVCILRATTADEHEGAYLGGLDQAIATRNNGGLIIAQVKRLTARCARMTCGCRAIWWTCSCWTPIRNRPPPPPYDPTISGEILRPSASFTLAEHGVEKVIARRAAMELRAGQTANLGFGISAMVPRVLLEESQAQSVTWAIEQGAVRGMPLSGFAFGCASNADAFVPSPQQFTYFQGGGFDVSFLSFLEVDVEGNVNVSMLGKKPYLTAGCGGFVDITSQARRIVFSGWFEAGAEIALSETELSVVKPGKFTKMVPAVEHVTYSGARGRALGQDVLYITERCMIRATETGLVAVEVMPGIDPARDIVAASQGRVSIAENAKAMPLSLLADGPMGLRL